MSTMPCPSRSPVATCSQPSHEHVDGTLGDRFRELSRPHRQPTVHRPVRPRPQRRPGPRRPGRARRGRRRGRPRRRLRAGLGGLGRGRRRRLYNQRIIGRVTFQRAWLARHGLVARNCRIIQVSAESMEPPPDDGCSILVNHASRRRYVGHIYVVRTADGLVVKRAGPDPASVWQLVSDNPDKRIWPNRPWPPTP